MRLPQHRIQHEVVRKFFIANHPEWMLEASPAAFDEQERTSIAETVITRPVSPARRLQDKRTGLTATVPLSTERAWSTAL